MFRASILGSYLKAPVLRVTTEVAVNWLVFWTREYYRHAQKYNDGDILLSIRG